MSTNEVVEHDNPFAWAWELGTEEATGEGNNIVCGTSRLNDSLAEAEEAEEALPPMPGSDTATPADDDLCRTEALFSGGDDEAYHAGPSSGHALGTHGPTGLFESDAASAVPDPVSGGRIIEVKEPRSRRKIDPKVFEEDRYVCLWTPCGSSRTFGRPAELQRHYTDKHVRPQVYRCTAVAYSGRCGKEYYRPDKLRYHCQTEHPQETEFVCPIPACNAQPYTFDLLCVHMGGHDTATIKSCGLQWHWFIFRGYPSSCPVKDCGSKLMFPDKLHTHLGTHDANTRAKNREAIRGAGYSELLSYPLCPICGDIIDIDKGGDFVDEGTGKREFLRPIWFHIFRCHRHEPEMLHKHRRDILKIDTYNYRPLNSFEERVFKDVLPTRIVRK